ncbi:hypothetical protein J132_09230 [Termitomyces sp. J132]|nr:hypothetical protein J132_09230 [Termitomyces sp. J132]
MVVPPIKLTMEWTVEDYANRLHRLRHTSPVIEQLMDEWCYSREVGNPPPLPHRKKTRKKGAAKLTQLECTARLTYRLMEGDVIDPFVAPSWRKTAKGQPQHISIIGAPVGCKKGEEAKKHNEKVENLERDDTWLLVYSWK